MNVEINQPLPDSTVGPWALASTLPEGARTWDVAVWPGRAILRVRFKDGGNVALQGTHEQVVERFVRVAIAFDFPIGWKDVRDAIQEGAAALAELATKEATP